MEWKLLLKIRTLKNHSITTMFLTNPKSMMIWWDHMFNQREHQLSNGYLSIRRIQKAMSQEENCTQQTILVKDNSVRRKIEGCKHQSKNEISMVEHLIQIKWRYLQQWIIKQKLFKDKRHQPKREVSHHKNQEENLKRLRKKN